MNPLYLLIATAAPAAADEDIVVTASREPIERVEAPASVSVIEGETLQNLGLPLASDALRLLPGVAVAVGGPAGSQAQLRIRGGEANHSLLFIDGIRFNDPAAANEARFELLTSDALTRLELIRGPQSALWGAEALGGVVAVSTADPRSGNALSARAEYGSLDTGRASAQGAYSSGDFAISATGSWIRSDGIDAFGSGGERDGYWNRTASLKALYRPADTLEIGAVGHWVQSRNEFDGYDPDTFLRTDTMDLTRNRILAGRAWLKTELGTDRSWTLSMDASLLGSRNHNFRDTLSLNQTWGRRFTASVQLSKRADIGGTRQQLTVAAEYQKETFRARDTDNFGLTNQDRSRDLTAFTGQWRADWADWLSSDIAIRHDRFSDFADTTTLRASLMVRPAPGWSLHAAYGEGVAQPTFYDLFGFFPSFYVGNPDLTSESGHGWEAGVRWSRGPTSIAVTAFQARLKDEIVLVFSPVTTSINALSESPRRGIEIEAEHRFGGRYAIMANYTLLDADQPDVGGIPLREVRRARHSANLVATGKWGPMRAAASIAYVGKRMDTDEEFPYPRVRLDDYVLASLTIAYDIGQGVEAYARVENAFDADYQDQFRYATAGRTIHAGLRLRLGD